MIDRLLLSSDNLMSIFVVVAVDLTLIVMLVLMYYFHDSILVF